MDINLNIKECKFCLEQSEQDLMISPCDCKGTVKYVHIKCLENYHIQNEHKNDKCGMCNYIYNYTTETNYELIFKLFKKYLIIITNNLVSIFCCFDSDILNFFKFAFYLYIFKLFFEYGKLYKTQRYLIDKNTLSEFNNKILLSMYSNHLLVSYVFILFYKFLVNINVIVLISTKELYKNLYILITLLHFINIVKFIIIKSEYKIIINKKNKN
jgi:hypothetical protein